MENIYIQMVHASVQLCAALDVLYATMELVRSVQMGIIYLEMPAYLVETDFTSMEHNAPHAQLGVHHNVIGNMSAFYAHQETHIKYKLEYVPIHVMAILGKTQME